MLQIPDHFDQLITNKVQEAANIAPLTAEIVSEYGVESCMLEDYSSLYESFYTFVVNRIAKHQRGHNNLFMIMDNVIRINDAETWLYSLKLDRATLLSCADDYLCDLVVLRVCARHLYNSEFGSRHD